jgi:hypothetical protein
MNGNSAVETFTSVVGGTVPVIQVSPAGSSGISTTSLIGIITGVVGVLATMFFGVTTIRYRNKSTHMGQRSTFSGYAKYIFHGDLHVHNPGVTAVTIVHQVSNPYKSVTYSSVKRGLNHFHRAVFSRNM